MQEFCNQSDIEVLYVTDREDLCKIRTKAVIGDMSAAEALTRMLRGTPFTFMVDSDHSVIIRPKRETGQGSALPEPHIKPQPFAARSTLAEIQITSSAPFGGSFPGSPHLDVTPHDFSLASHPTAQDALHQLPINSLNTPRQGTMGDFADASNIPADFVERVDILPDGTSALYGSDAIAGVVNIILRKDIDGAQTSIHVGSALKGNRQLMLSQLDGAHWRGERDCWAMSSWTADDCRQLIACMRQTSTRRPWVARAVAAASQTQVTCLII